MYVIEYSVETEKDKRSAREKLRYVEIIRVVRKFGLDRAQRARLGLRAAKKKRGEYEKRGELISDGVGLSGYSVVL